MDQDKFEEALELHTYIKDCEKIIDSIRNTIIKDGKDTFLSEVEYFQLRVPRTSMHNLIDVSTIPGLGKAIREFVLDYLLTEMLKAKDKFVEI